MVGPARVHDGDAGRGQAARPPARRCGRCGRSRASSRVRSGGRSCRQVRSAMLVPRCSRRPSRTRASAPAATITPAATRSSPSWACLVRLSTTTVRWRPSTAPGVEQRVARRCRRRRADRGVDHQQRRRTGAPIGCRPRRRGRAPGEIAVEVGHPHVGRVRHGIDDHGGGAERRDGAATTSSLATGCTRRAQRAGGQEVAGLVIGRAVDDDRARRRSPRSSSATTVVIAAMPQLVSSAASSIVAVGVGLPGVGRPASIHRRSQSRPSRWRSRR